MMTNNDYWIVSTLQELAEDDPQKCAAFMRTMFAAAYIHGSLQPRLYQEAKEGGDMAVFMEEQWQTVLHQCMKMIDAGVMDTVLEAFGKENRGFGSVRAADA